jgi:hypothetical protein
LNVLAHALTSSGKLDDDQNEVEHNEDYKDAENNADCEDVGCLIAGAALQVMPRYFMA